MAFALPKLSSIIGPPRFLGVDIGTTSIKVAELAKEGGVVRLANYGLLENFGHLERENEVLQTSSLKLMDELTAEMLGRLLSELKPATRRAIFSLPIFSTFVTVIELPEMSRDEINQAIPYEAKQYVPTPLSEVALDWMILGPREGETKRVEVLLIAVPQEMVSKYQRIAKLADLNLEGLEIETISLSRSVLARDQTLAMLVDIGSRVTNISIVDKGYVRMTRSIEKGGADLTQAIANGLSLSPFKAEEIKKTRGLRVNPGEEELAELLRPQLDLIIVELQKLGEIYFERTREEVKKIVLVGGSALLPGVPEYFGENLGKEVAVASPFQGLKYDPMLEPILRELGSSFAVAVGLALRELTQ
ncbi:MAG: type IV pilus assembly protein PilM [Parcubacteria group bacterium]|nr:type IV pilus assembly protein PilM [Parcubacteria group bacterium]